MTLFFSNNEIQVYRTRRVGVANKWTLSATFTVYPATIEPANPERVNIESGQIGHLFTAFLNTDAHIKEGDEIRTETKKYSVKGVSRWEGSGLLDHLELTLMAGDDNG